MFKMMVDNKLDSAASRAHCNRFSFNSANNTGFLDRAATPFPADEDTRFTPMRWQALH